jgi:hypothetical protein
MRRTPELTKQCRNLFEEEVLAHQGTWQPYGTIYRIAETTGLKPEQVRDAIWNPEADTWRNGFEKRLAKINWDNPDNTKE